MRSAFRGGVSIHAQELKEGNKRLDEADMFELAGSTETPVKQVHCQDDIAALVVQLCTEREYRKWASKATDMIGEFEMRDVRASEMGLEIRGNKMHQMVGAGI